MPKTEEHDKLPKDAKKGDVLKLKMGEAYITVTIQEVKQESPKHVRIVTYQYETPKLG